MINYAREQAIEILKTASHAILATTGPKGVQVGDFPCEADGLNIYILLPSTSDHLFNLSQDSRVAMHSDGWELTGNGSQILQRENWPQIPLIQNENVGWYALVKIIPGQIQIPRFDGWGSAETIDVIPSD